MAWSKPGKFSGKMMAPENVFVIDEDDNNDDNDNTDDDNNVNMGHGRDGPGDLRWTQMR